MTELTRLFDMMRALDASLFLCPREDGMWFSQAVISPVAHATSFAAIEPSPEAAVADLVLQLGEWQSKREGGAG